ncbi:hypothetical protein DYB26_011625 [Aphanomyces astaci]|uniref:Uncharacterized protein n=1 Tax=Aphanomyces astaci TaxID=112090 RepID=A0A418FRQ2_APHAT|nr:hypothetical protein DYB26_011625 [Aphanomyces astaci]
MIEPYVIQLNTPLGQKPLKDPSVGAVPEATDVSSFPPPPAQFHTHELDTAPLDSLAHQFQTTNLNSTSSFGPAALSIQQDDPFQPVPTAYSSSFPISSTTFQAPPPPSAKPLDLFSSNFNSADSVGASDAFATNDPHGFARAPPLPPARRDSFNSPFETAPTNDSFRQIQYQPPATPPPPAAPFLNYNSSPNTKIAFNQPPPSASPKPFGVRPPPSPPQPPAQDITTAIRTTDDLFYEFMSHVSPDKLPTPSATDLPPTLDTLVGLYRQQQWQQLETKAWSMLTSPDPQFNLHVHTWAMVAQMKLGKVDDLEQQVIVLGDLDQYQYENYPERFPSKQGSFVPMRLRYMTVQLPRLKNNVSMYETMASQLLLDLDQNTFQLSPEDATSWHNIVTVNLIHSFLDRKKFDVALRLATSLYERTTTATHRVILASRLGRIYLQVGDLKRAEGLFADAAALSAEISDPHRDCAARVLLNQGLLHFAHNRVQDIIAANNMSICALYSCQVQTAVTVLETVLQSDPRRHLHSAVVFNLSTLYDLVCDNVNSTNRKNMIKRVAEAYNVEHIDNACFRI